MLILRDMKQSDIENYVRWFTTQTSWGLTDAPWEPFESSPEEERKSWIEYYEQMQNAPSEYVRWKFEIEVDGIHIGWVSAYKNTEWFPNPNEHYAIGIDIADDDYRGKGYGTIALQKFIDYYRKKGEKTIYTQTWSGNLPMIAVAKKLGFSEVARKVGFREVNGIKYDALTYELKLDLLE